MMRYLKGLFRIPDESEEMRRLTRTTDKTKINRDESKAIYHEATGKDLFLISEFNLEKCKEISGDAVVLANDNKAYFIRGGHVVMDDHKPQFAKEIDRQGIPLCSSIIDLIKPETSKEAVNKIIRESTQKLNSIQAEQPREWITSVKRHHLIQG